MEFWVIAAVVGIVWFTYWFTNRKPKVEQRFKPYTPAEWESDGQ